MHDCNHDLPANDEAIALLAHEMRGPLTVIVGYLDMLERPIDEHERALVVAALRRAANRLDRMLDDMTEGRGPTCAARLALDRVRARDLVERVASDGGATTGRRIELEATGDATIEVDEQRMEAALGNLISNADKYSPSDAPIYIILGEKPGAVTITVEDEGPGIPEEERRRVLERFERLRRDDELPGTGLGLAVVREIVEGHGGSVEIGSTPEGGASVRLELPAVL
ncbi:MAG: HAMP domain-containing histidine kinase [Coriobacteriales bacterium]|nr:HAMP domain-containing histidine kinase [Coriobacteriales bacterium]